MTWAVYSAVGGPEITPAELRAGIAAWAASADVEPGTDGPEPHYRFDLVADARGGAWLTFGEPRGDGAVHALRALAQVVARHCGRSLQVLIAGAEDGSQSHTVVGYQVLSVDPDGEFAEHEHAGGDAYCAEANPVPDDCPYEEFDGLLNELLGTEALEPVEDEPAGDDDDLCGEYCSIRYSGDERLNGLIVAARGGAPHELEPQPDGRTLLKVTHGDGTRHLTYLTSEEAATFTAAVKT